MSDTTPLADYKGHRALKDFGQEFYSGHVRSSFYKAGRELWRVIHEDNGIEDYHTDELLRIILPAGIVDIHLLKARHPLKSKYDLISTCLRLGRSVEKFLSQDLLRKYFNCRTQTAERNLSSGLNKMIKIKIKILSSECQTSGKYSKRAKQATKKRQHRGLLVFSELPSLPSAGSRPGCFHTSLGCTPRSLIRVSLGWFDYSKKNREDNPTPAYSPVSS
jgi:hypothetical protein